MHIRNPVEWSGAQLVGAAQALGSAYRSLHHIQDTIHTPAPRVRKITSADIGAALLKGYDDFAAYRSDVLFLCVVYAVAGLVLARVALRMNLLPMLFPLAAGFALIGPFAAVGLYEMSRKREQGAQVTWANAFDVLREPAIGAIAVLGLLLIALFGSWLGAAWLIYRGTLGPEAPASLLSFLHDTFTTHAGWLMILYGTGTGLLFAVLALALSIVSFPLLLDRDVGLDTAIAASFRAVKMNPLPMAVWGLTVAAGLVIGTIPAFVGLIVVLPVLGHATWHLYRALVAR